MSGRWVSLRPSQERETRRVFGEWPSPIDRDATPKREIRFAPLSRKAPLLPPLLEGVADNVALAPISASSRIERAKSVELAVKRMADAVSSVLSLNEGDRHVRAQFVGEALGVAVGAGRFYAYPEGFRLATLPSWVRRR